MSDILATGGRRGLASRARPLLVPVAVTAVAFAIALVVIALIGDSPFDAAAAFFEGAFGDSQATSATIVVMLPLVLVALAWVVSSSARQLNLGLEGQILMGGVGAGVVGGTFTSLPAFVHLPLAVVAGVVCGAAYAALPALLYLWRDVSVLLSSFLLNFVAVLVVAWLVRGPLQDPTAAFLLQSKPIDLDAAWPRMGTSGLTFDVLFIPLGVVLLLVVQRVTTMGFRLRLVYANEDAARFSGIDTRRFGAVAMLASGAIAGLAGSSLILGSPSGTIVDGFSSQYGFIGIAVALLALNSPTGIVVAALLFAALQQGGGLVETRVGVASAIVDVTQGLVIILVAGSAWVLLQSGRLARGTASFGSGER